MNRLRIYADRDIRRNGIGLLVVQETEDGKLRYISDVTMSDDVPDKGTEGLFLDYPEAQNLMNELWNARVRPSEDVFTPAESQAMKKTINVLEAEVTFLRSLVRHHLGIIT